MKKYIFIIIGFISLLGLNIYLIITVNNLNHNLSNLELYITNTKSNSPYRLNLTSKYGDNQAYHPKVLAFNKKWHGYKYYIAYSPYPYAESKYENPWKKDFGRKDALKNYKVASMYSKSAGYKLFGMEKYTTMDSKLKTLFPVTLLIELGGVRAHPLSQFMDFDIPGSNEDFKYVYTKIINNNTKALIDTLPVMLEISKKVY